MRDKRLWDWWKSEVGEREEQKDEAKRSCGVGAEEVKEK